MQVKKWDVGPGGRRGGEDRQARGIGRNTVGGKNRMSGGSNMEGSWHEMKVTASAENS